MRSFSHSDIAIILFCVVLLDSMPTMQADLMDLISEASCAARCFKRFTKSLTGQDKLFLQQRPDLTQPHCIHQKGTCSLCLDVCQWPRDRSTNCSAACQVIFNGDDPSTQEEARQTCVGACTFAQYLFTRSDQFVSGEIAASCGRLDSWPPACQPTCLTDADCLPMGMRKCCPSQLCTRDSNKKQQTNGTWSRVCTPGVIASKAVPFVPGRPLVKQSEVVTSSPATQHTSNTGSIVREDPQYQLELDWQDYYNLTRPDRLGWGPDEYPAVFLVQLRLFNDPMATMQFLQSKSLNPSRPIATVGGSEDWSFMDRVFGDWRSLVWTTKLGAVLSDLRPGTWYQFRLISISAAGHGGWSEPSQPIRVLTRPVPPSSPRNLTESRSRIADNSVHVTTRWQAPTAGNLPLKKYQVSWRQYYGFHGDDRSSFTEYEANVPGDKTVYTIQNLKPGTSYKIQVRAVSEFEGKELKSHAISLFINTLSVPSQQKSRESSQLWTSNDTCRCGEAAHPPVRTGEPYLDKGEVKATLLVAMETLQTHPTEKYTIEWSPRVCIETQQPPDEDAYMKRVQTVTTRDLMHFELRHLRFRCHYKVIVTAQSTASSAIHRSTREWKTCFCTPSCHAVRVVSGPGPANCTNTAAVTSLKPLKLTYKLASSERTTPDTVPSITSFPEANDLSLRTGTQSKNPQSPSQGTTETTFDAMVNWHPVSEKLHPLTTTSGTESRRSFRALSARQRANPVNGIRGVRVTWGPRLYEPIEPEAYHDGMKPYLDPERTQSKVLEPHSSQLLLRGLKAETLYIVTVQVVGEQMDGPMSSIFFSVPVTGTKDAVAQLGWSNLLWIITLLVLAVNW